MLRLCTLMLTGSEILDGNDRSFFSWCFTSTETVWLIKDRVRMGSEMRVQAHLLFHTAPDLWQTGNYL